MQAACGAKQIHRALISVAHLAHNFPESIKRLGGCPILKQHRRTDGETLTAPLFVKRELQVWPVLQSGPVHVVKPLVQPALVQWLYFEDGRIEVVLEVTADKSRCIPGGRFSVGQWLQQNARGFNTSETKYVAVGGENRTLTSQGLVTQTGK